MTFADDVGRALRTRAEELASYVGTCDGMQKAMVQESAVCFAVIGRDSTLVSPGDIMLPKAQVACTSQHIDFYTAALHGRRAPQGERAPLVPAQTPPYPPVTPGPLVRPRRPPAARQPPAHRQALAGMRQARGRS